MLAPKVCAAFAAGLLGSVACAGAALADSMSMWVRASGSILPCLAVYLALQRYYVSGLLSGGAK